MIVLPPPKTKGAVSLEESIANRRSIRDFLDKALSLTQLSQILWSANSVPSAGGLYPLEIYLVIKKGGVEGVESGVYHYQPENHSLELQLKEYNHQDFVSACLSQEPCDLAPVSLVIAAVYERTTGKYGERGIQYVHLEAGHAAQNICLQVAALNLGTVTIGAFIDKEVSRILNLPDNHQPLYILPLGWPG